MKQQLLSFLQTFASFLSHIIQLGFQDGIRFFFLKPDNNHQLTWEFKNIKHPIHLRGKGSDKLVMEQVFYHKDYQIPLSFEPNVILDCGANIGLATIFFRNRYTNAAIIAIEPESENFELLKKNTSYYDNIFIEQKGIWNRKCNLEIFEGPDKKPWSFFLKPTEKPAGENIIEAIGIRELMEKYNLEYIDLLKIDIEGAEQELFESNYEDWLPKVKVMIIELLDRFKPLSSKNFLKVISQYNFNIYFKGENIIATQVFK